MYTYLVSVYSWESPKLCSSDAELKKGDHVLIKEELGNEVGIVHGLSTSDKQDANKSTIVRVAADRDIEIFEKNKEKKGELFSLCRSEIKRLKLQMKLIDVHISFDGSNVIIVFTADERVDFRELVKNLARIFHRSIRMHQIGSRDEARKVGGCGVCGRGLCCLRFSGNLPSISIEMARVQQVAHRGSERISGECGRLMCCLSYEAQQYQEMLEGMPEVHSSIMTKEGKGDVLEVNGITQEVKVRLNNGGIVTISKKDLK